MTTLPTAGMAAEYTEEDQQNSNKLIDHGPRITESCPHCTILNTEIKNLQRGLAKTEQLWRQQRARADHLAAIIREYPL